MSGSSYNYAYRAVDLFREELQVTTPLREQFKNHLHHVAQAMHDIEWVDSCDYQRGAENDAINACLSAHAGEPQAGETLTRALELLQAYQVAEITTDLSDPFAFAHVSLDAWTFMRDTKGTAFANGEGCYLLEEGKAPIQADMAIPQKRQHAGEGKAEALSANDELVRKAKLIVEKYGSLAAFYAHLAERAPLVGRERESLD